MKIAFFDSGAGGLSVLNEAMRILPDEKYVYFADSDNAPYGTKSKSKILRLVNDAVSFIDHKWELKALVLACNTATSIAVKYLRKNYDFPIIGMEPAVKPALQLAKEKEVVVCATDLTLKEDKLGKLVDKLKAKDRVKYLSLQDLVIHAENLAFDDDQVRAYLKGRFREINWEMSGALVLGCTHFLFYKDLIKELIPKDIKIVDGNLGTVNNLKSKVILDNESTRGDIKYYLSKERVAPERFNEYFKILNQEIN